MKFRDCTGRGHRVALIQSWMSPFAPSAAFMPAMSGEHHESQAVSGKVQDRMSLRKVHTMKREEVPFVSRITHLHSSLTGSSVQSLSLTLFAC